MRFMKKTGGNSGRLTTGGVGDAENSQNHPQHDVLTQKKVPIQGVPK